LKSLRVFVIKHVTRVAKGALTPLRLVP